MLVKQEELFEEITKNEEKRKKIFLLNLFLMRWVNNYFFCPSIQKNSLRVIISITSLRQVFARDSTTSVS